MAGVLAPVSGGGLPGGIYMDDHDRVFLVQEAVEADVAFAIVETGMIGNGVDAAITQQLGEAVATVAAAFVPAPHPCVAAACSAASPPKKLWRLACLGWLVGPAQHIPGGVAVPFLMLRRKVKVSLYMS